IHPTENQIDDVIDRLNGVIKRNERAIITTISKRSAEELSRYLDRVGIKNNYLHSDIETLDRIKILEDLREGRIDVVVGVNLLREGIDLPEVSIVMILDADKEGFLRNVRSLTQVIGRAARHPNGVAVLYGDTMSKTMMEVVRESVQRRAKQIEYNFANDLLPKRAKKSSNEQNAIFADIEALGSDNDAEERRNALNDILQGAKSSAPKEEKRGAKSEAKRADIVAEECAEYNTESQSNILEQNIDKLIDEMRTKMEAAAKELDFQAAKQYRDKMYELQKIREEMRK
ncbi:MAG: helicase-related protein, partial [Alistipes sp.]|nr:helicase-related protein [Alistipes sp.]